MTSYGFCPERIGHFSFPEGGDGEFVIQKPYSSKVEQQIDIEVDKLLNDVYTRTNDLLTTHWDQVKLVAEKLLEKEEVTAEELVTILGPHPHASEELGYAARTRPPPPHSPTHPPTTGSTFRLLSSRASTR